MKKIDYENHLKRRLHKGPNEKSTNAFVKLKFSYIESGKEYTLLVSRAWTLSNKRLLEELSLFVIENNKYEQTISNPQEFLLNLFPIGLSQLLFFDGEKIKKFAESTDPNGLLRDGFHSIIGLDLVTRAKRDLGSYITGTEKANSKGYHSKYQEIDKDLQHLTRKLDNTTENFEEIENDIEQSESNLTEIEQQLAREGSEFAKRREEFQSKKNKVEADLEIVKKEITRLCDGLLPFSFALNLARRTRGRLSDERRIKSLESKRTTIDEIKTALSNAMLEESFWKGSQSDDTKKQTIKKMSDVVDAIAINPTEEIPIRHDTSESQSYMISDGLHKATTSVIDDFTRLIAEYNLKESEVIGLKQDLDRAPIEEAIQPIVDQLNNMIKKIAKLETMRGVMIEEKETLLQSIEEKKLEQERLLEQIQKEAKHVRKIEHAFKTLEVLRQFEQHLETSRTTELQQRFTQIFNKLRPPTKQVKDIEIDPKTLSATLRELDGSSKESSMLSAGEKQIYAMALLFSIIGVSNRPFPLLIDTPLARLDKKHRKNVVTHLMNSATDQLILFATNTEITKAIKKAFEPFLCRKIHLQFNGDSGSTSPFVEMEVS